MAKEAYINARVDRQLKERAEKGLAEVGIGTTDAVTMMLHQIVLRRGLPFEVRILNRETISAMEELDAGTGESSADATGDVFEKAVRKRSPRFAGSSFRIARSHDFTMSRGPASPGLTSRASP